MRNQELHPRTAAINKSQKNKSRKSRMDALAWLEKTFPDAFNNTSAIHPLKSGIMQDILQHAEEAQAVGISKSKLREAVVLVTRRIDYLTCLKAKETRIDLNGNPVAQVSDTDAEKAAQKIKKRVEKGLRNARKNALKSALMDEPNKPASTYTPRKLVNRTEEGYLPVYPQRSSVTPVSQVPAQKAETVVIKHKTSRQYDPSVVARLKEKLGISRKLEEMAVEE